MKNWKIIIDCEGKTIEITVEAKYYSDAYVSAEVKYPGCTVLSITEIRS